MRATRLSKVTSFSADRPFLQVNGLGPQFSYLGHQDTSRVMPTYEIIDLGFSTADGEQLELRFVGGDIQFSFVDWRELPVRFTAIDVRAFSWLEEFDVPSIRNDVTYEVSESNLIQKYCDWNVISTKDGYRHFKLCFNAAGVFDVVCKTIKVIQP